MKQKNYERDFRIDILKLLALFHMVYDHLYITLYDSSKNYFILDFIDNIIPICPAFFLFLSAYILSATNGLYKIKKRLYFAAFLAIVSSIFFIAEHGFQFPDMIFASGILYTIALSIFIGVIAVHISKNTIRTFTILSIAMTLIFFFLRLTEINIFHLTTGYEPFLPTIIYGMYGYLYGELLKKEYITKSIHWIITSSSIAIFTIMSFIYGIFKPLFPDVGRYTIERVFNSKYMIQELFINNVNTSFYRARIWNFDIICFIYTTVIIFIVLHAINIFMDDKTNTYHNSKKTFLYFLLLPSRYLIFNYIIHLLIIALTTTFFGFGILSATQFVATYWIGIIGIYIVSFIIESSKKVS